MRRRLAFVSALSVVLVAGAAAAVRADEPRLLPASPTLPAATVGKPYNQAFQIVIGTQGDGAGRFIGCRIKVPDDRQDLKQYEYDDCAKLPPGLTLLETPSCSNSRNGCNQLSGTPTKEGTSRFRISSSDGLGGFITREYTLVVKRAEPQSDLRVVFDRSHRDPGSLVVRFNVVNGGPDKSKPVKVKFTAFEAGSKKVKFTAYNPPKGGRLNTHSECKGLTCSVSALDASFLAAEQVVLEAELVGVKEKEGGTYVKVRVEVDCVDKRDPSCDDNVWPSSTRYERFTVPGP